MIPPILVLFLNYFPMCFSHFLLLFLVAPFHVLVASQFWMLGIPKIEFLVCRLGNIMAKRWWSQISLCLESIKMKTCVFYWFLAQTSLIAKCTQPITFHTYLTSNMSRTNGKRDFCKEAKTRKEEIDIPIIDGCLPRYAHIWYGQRLLM